MSWLESKKARGLCLLVLALALSAPAAFANELGNGDTAPPDVFDNVGGALLNSIVGTITTPTFSANYTEWVYSDPNNTFCVNCLDFVYQFTNNGPNVLERFTAFAFDGFRVDVGYEANSGANVPLSVDRSTSGAVIGFDYTGADNLLPGQSTALLVIETNAASYTDGFVTAQDGTSGSGPAFAPAPTVPEPSSLGMLGTGILIAGGMLKRRLF
jgi:hypothetical protein